MRHRLRLRSCPRSRSSLRTLAISCSDEHLNCRLAPASTIRPSIRPQAARHCPRNLAFDLVDEARPGERRGELLHLNRRRSAGAGGRAWRGRRRQPGHRRISRRGLSRTGPARPRRCRPGWAPPRRWFYDLKFDREVTRTLLEEDYEAAGAQRAAGLRSVTLANAVFHILHLRYTSPGSPTGGAGWPATSSPSPTSPPAYLSGGLSRDIPWDVPISRAKDWYARVKSRPSFRPLLGDHLPGAPPPRHYADLDF